MNWTDTSVLITGAASGIGRALAKELDGTGAKLSLVDLDEDALGTLEEELGVSSEERLIRTADVTDEDAMQSVVEETERKLGGPGVVVANAGLGYPTPADNFSLPRAKRLLDVNLNGVVNTVIPAIDRMVANDSGRVVIVSSVAAFVNFKGGASYCASKAGVLRLAEGLRLDLRDENVGVTTIHPGWVETEMTRPYERDLRLFEVSPRKAAGYIRRGIEREKRQVIFPWQARLMVGLLEFVPDALVDFLLAKLPGPEEFTKEPLPEVER